MRNNIFFKIVLMVCVLSMVSLICCAEEPTTSFSENFNRFKLYISYNGTTQNSIINSGKPVDGDYSNTTVYPNGAESIYEGNMANNLYVYDAKGNKIYGGIEGWIGHYFGVSGDYNKSNRRLTLRNDGKFADNNVLAFEPAKGSDGSYSTFARENIDLCGISVWESDVNIATPGSGTADNDATFTLSITKNPLDSGKEYEQIIPLAQLATKDCAKDAPGEIRFFGEKVKDIKVISMYSTSKLYTIKYVLDNTGEVPMHWIVLKEGVTEVATTEPIPVENYEEFFTEDATYGILYKAESVYEKLAPRFLLDNINFYKANPIKITNKAEIESKTYELKNTEINIQFDGNIKTAEGGIITLTDVSGKTIDVQVTKNTNSLTVNTASLNPQEVYTLKINNLPYGDGLYFSDELKIKTMTSATVTSAERKTNAVEFVLNNNCAEDKSYIVILKAMDGKLNVASGIYYKKVIVPGGDSIPVTIENIVLGDVKEENVKYNIFVIDSLIGLHSFAEKYEF
jgi:hypothetical protein